MTDQEKLREAIRLLNAEGWETIAYLLEDATGAADRAKAAPGGAAEHLRADIAELGRGPNPNESKALALLDAVSAPEPACARCGHSWNEHHIGAAGGGGGRCGTCGPKCDRFAESPIQEKPVGGQGERIREAFGELMVRAEDANLGRLVVTLGLAALAVEHGAAPSFVAGVLRGFPCHPDAGEREIRDRALQILRGEA